MLIDAPPPLAWAASHAALPALGPASAEGGRQLYFSSRDAEGRSRVARCDVSFSSPAASLKFHPDPAIDFGPLGAFDDSGATSACVVEHGGLLWQYYTGWTRGGTVPFTLAIGCAMSEDAGGTWTKVSPAPVLGRTAVDPLLTASPCVLVENGTWRMWYVSATRWTMVNGVAKHWYHIRYAESDDGLTWTPTGHVCVDFADEHEHAIARPCVVRDGSLYRMWFCARGESYRLGYAESGDGLTWRRDDTAVRLQPSAAGWDSEMVAYPWVFDDRGTTHMLYNGNGYGRTGIGWAVLE